MKKRIISITLVLIFILALAPSAAASADISVTIEGQPVTFADQPPVVREGRTLVPVRGVFEDLGFVVDWERHAPQTATLTGSGFTVHITVGSAEFTVNGAPHTLDVPAQVIGGRTMLPIRAVLEAVGLYVGWHAGLNIVMISASPVEDAPEHITIGGRQFRTSLTAISLYNMNLTNEDILPLRHVLNLRELTLSRNNISDISPLAGLRNLEILRITDNEISNVSPLAGLENLRSLYLRGNRIHDFSPVAHIVDPTLQIQRLSSMTLPDRRLTDAERQQWIAEYLETGGLTAFEAEVARLVNEIRARYGLSQLQVDTNLAMAARFYTQLMVDLNTPLGHNEGPYATNPAASHGASANVAAAFGGNLRWNGGNGSAGRWTPEALLDAWMNSPGHSAYILSPEHRFIGPGTNPGGRFGVFHYLFLSSDGS